MGLLGNMWGYIGLGQAKERQMDMEHAVQIGLCWGEKNLGVRKSV